MGERAEEGGGLRASARIKGWGVGLIIRCMYPTRGGMGGMDSVEAVRLVGSTHERSPREHDHDASVWVVMYRCWRCIQAMTSLPERL